MSLFSQTIAKAISDYRQIMRRYLTSEERAQKIAKLNLKDPTIYHNEITLYKTAHAIVQDIQENVKIPDQGQGYYSYNGIKKFAEYLQDYLSHYDADDEEVIHKAQKASRALIQAIQLMTLPDEQLTSSVATQLIRCGQIIASSGTHDQQELYHQTLNQQYGYNEEFYQKIIEVFHSQVREEDRVAA